MNESKPPDVRDESFKKVDQIITENSSNLKIDKIMWDNIKKVENEIKNFNETTSETVQKKIATRIRDNAAYKI